MAEFNIRSESVDVEQIMKQIRTRIREKRGVDYTEDQIRELAAVRLEKFLDPKNLRSDLLEQFRKSRPALPEPPKDPPAAEPPYVFDDETLFHSHRAPLRFIRKLLRPLVKLFINPNTLNQILHTQAQFNLDILKRDLRRRYEFQQQLAGFERSRGEWNVLYYEVLHNLVLETTRQSIDVKNLKMRVEALASRLDFSERRVRALEGVVQYRPEAVRPQRDRQPVRYETADLETAPSPGPDDAAGAGTVTATATGTGQGVTPATGGESGRRRRRRRRGRRGAGVPGTPTAGGDQNADADAQAGSEGQDSESDLDQGADLDQGMDQAGGDGEGFDGGFDSEGDLAPDDHEPGSDPSTGSGSSQNRSEDDEQ